jgi:hypothetical protein
LIGGLVYSPCSLQAGPGKPISHPDSSRSQHRLHRWGVLRRFADIGSNDDIIQTIAESLGVALSGDEDIKTQLLTYLAPRRRLLVLDNLEHLDGAAIIAEILKAAPNVKVVATSRSQLNLTGETVLSLSGLDITWDHPEGAMLASGAQLFIVAAKRSNPSFVLKTDDLDALAEILHLVDGMPLGILLAAAWVDMLSVGEIAAEIRKSFDFLETEMRDVPVRQRSIRAVFDSSWGLLSLKNRTLSRRFPCSEVGSAGRRLRCVLEHPCVALQISLASHCSPPIPTPDATRYMSCSVNMQPPSSKRITIVSDRFATLMLPSMRMLWEKLLS